MEKLCPVVVEATLKKNNFSITETARELVMERRELHDFLEQFGIRKGPPVGEFNLDPKEELQTALKMIEEIMEYCDECADFSNGNTDGLGGYVDEGRVKASSYFDTVKRKVQLLKDRNNL